MKGLSILGSTGSIGTNTLRVVEAFPDRFRVVALAGGRNVERLADQIARHRPRTISVASETARERLGRLVDLSGMEVGVGQAGMIAVATHAEAQMVVASAVGAVGLVPTYRAIEAGKDMALANKETLVMAGELIVKLARERGVRLLPIDSEHCALHQCLAGRAPETVERLILTASGGPFRSRPRDAFHRVTPEEALAHPTWSMGKKITIDSATMMNKGLEVIEARWLFGIEAEHIGVLIHPQSIVHSMVEFRDGTLLAQLGVTDMRVPIQYALSYPEVWEAAIPRFDLSRARHLDFEPPDGERFPCLDLAYGALARGGSLPAVLNAANEEAVGSFLEGMLPFPGIADTIAAVMGDHPPAAVGALEDVLAADVWARQRARERMNRRATLGTPA
jgi:1-deoxy-D-xylulose-5-phosphate reductoisomerase